MSKLKLAAKVLGALVLLVILAGTGLVGYAAVSADGRLAFPDAPAPAIVASTDPEVIEQGRYLVHGPAHCAQCHA